MLAASISQVLSWFLLYICAGVGTYGYLHNNENFNTAHDRVIGAFFWPLSWFFIFIFSVLLPFCWYLRYLVHGDEYADDDVPIEFLTKQVRFVKIPDNWAERGFAMYTLDEFKTSCTSGSLIDYDGFGHFVRNNDESNIAVIPSHVMQHKEIPEWATGVIWYNR